MSARNLKISGTVANVKELKESFRGNAELVLFDPKTKKVLSSTRLDKDTFDLSSNISTDKLPSEVLVAVVPDSKNAASVKRAIESGAAPVQKVTKSSLLAKEGLSNLKLQVDPGLIARIPDYFFNFVRVCGKVVKKDPKTGETCAVPGAVVKLYDVDFNFLSWSPVDWELFSWIYPFFIRRELLTTTTTNSCGEFCVFVPRFEIDAIIRWRKKLVCYPDFLLPIRWKDIIDKVPSLIGKTPIGPIGPDPGPIERMGLSQKMGIRADGFTDMSKLVSGSSSPLLSRTAMASTRSLGAMTNLSSSKLFSNHMAPPKGLNADSISKRLRDPKHVEAILNVKPLMRWRCTTYYEPEIEFYYDVPDLSFEVTQKINGTDQIIYETGLLDIMWDLSGDLNNVVLEANELAYCSPLCDYTPPTCTSSGLVGVGILPIDPMFIDSDGYAKRANRPKPLINPLNPALGIVSDASRPDAKSPFCSTLFIAGCPDLEASAKYYKLYYQRDGDPVEHYFSEAWDMWKIDTTEIVHVVPDGAGFYQILSPGDNYFPYHLVLNWPTGGYANGKYRLQLELFDGAKNSLGRKNNVFLYVDNNAPTILLPNGIQITGDMGTNKTFIPGVDAGCLTLTRKKGETLTVVIKTNISCSNLRDYGASLAWCSGSVVADVDGYSPSHPWSPSTYWHQAVDDNAVSQTLRFVIPPSAPQGGFYIYIEARARAQRALEGLETSWYVDPLYIWTPFTYPFAVIDT